MTIADPRAIALEFIRGTIGGGDLTVLERLLHDDVVVHLPASLEPFPLLGRREVTEFHRAATSAFIEGSVSADVTHVASTGTTVFLSLEVAAVFRNGHQYHNHYAFRFTVVDGLITEYREYTDSKYAASFPPPHERHPAPEQGAEA